MDVSLFYVKEFIKDRAHDNEKLVGGTGLEPVTSRL